MKTAQWLTARAVAAVGVGARALPWRASLVAGARLGDLARALGVRRRVAESNLALAFPEKTPATRARILVDHYRELGRVACEYPRMDELARAPEGVVIAGAEGREHLERAHALGRGVILVTGHFGNFELLGAWLARQNPLDFVVKPMSNPGVDAWVRRLRERAGVGQIPVGAGVRQIFGALRAKRWVAMVADQDVSHYGIFVPFFGRPSSTAVGPAEIASRTGAPIVTGFAVRGADQRLTLHLEPQLPEPAASDPDPVRTLTAAHTARLEAWVRRYPEMWFWLHRRWKSTPAPASDTAVVSPMEGLG